MPINETAKLGAKLTRMDSEQDTIKNNLSPDDTETQQQLYLSEIMKGGGTVTINQLEYDTNTFVIDHPVYGDVDSATLEIDGGYVEAGGATFPLTFPIVFTAGGAAKTELFTTTF